MFGSYTQITWVHSDQGIFRGAKNRWNKSPSGIIGPYNSCVGIDSGWRPPVKLSNIPTVPFAGISLAKAL
jgi:hypothetical protein